MRFVKGGKPPLNEALDHSLLQRDLKLLLHLRNDCGVVFIQYKSLVLVKGHHVSRLIERRLAGFTQLKNSSVRKESKL